MSKRLSKFLNKQISLKGNNCPYCGKPLPHSRRGKERHIKLCKRRRLKK